MKCLLASGELTKGDRLDIDELSATFEELKVDIDMVPMRYRIAIDELWKIIRLFTHEVLLTYQRTTVDLSTSYR